jgi:hypothetical protein
MRELPQAENQWLKYRWEFMRRDPCYRSAYVRATVDIPIEIYEEMITGVEGVAEIYHICGTYGLSKIIHPDLSFEELNEADKEALALGGLGVCDEMDLSPRVRLDYNELVIYIDFARINSLDALKHKALALIDNKYKAYFEEVERRLTDEFRKVKKDQTYTHHKKTIKLKDFERILTIGDLRQQGLTIEDIANQIFPGDASIESAIRKVRQHLKTYDALVDGGYINMTYP